MIGHVTTNIEGQKRTKSELHSTLVLFTRIILYPSQVGVTFELYPAPRLRGLPLEPQADFAVPQKARRQRHDELRTIACDGGADISMSAPIR